jgi:putative ATP-dependent endonuclease of OLD family
VYLSRLEVRGFRSLESVSIDLRRDVTVLVGENNSGKSNVIEVLRLLTDPLDGRRGRYPDAEDVFRGPGCDEVVATACYRGPDEDLAMYQHAMVPEMSEVRLGLRYAPPAGHQLRGQTRWVAGNGADLGDPQPRARERVRHVYLPALRDAARELGSAAAAGVRVILDSLLSGADPVRDPTGQPITREALLDHAATHLRQIEQHPVLTQAAERINTPLRRLTRGAYEQRAGLGFEAASLRSLARDLRLRMADVGLSPREIAESGMGYANLLYIAHVLTQLDAAAEADLTLLLVEEPEAHLHPPLQALLLDYLRDAAARSRTNRPEGQWRGYVQVIVTSHAPSLAASIEVTDLVVLQRRQVPAPPSSPDHAATVSRPVVADDRARYRTAAVGVGRLGLPPPDVRKLNRYLDATRSALLFSPRIMLVEGLGEALILPAAARVLLASHSVARDRFLGTALVPIDGVDFEPYLRVLLTAVDGARIGQRVAVITDGDRHNQHRTGAERIIRLNERIEALEAADHARVFSCETSLEAELLADNDQAVWSAWRRQQSQAWEATRTAVMQATAGLERKTEFAEAMRATHLRKGDFVQDFLEDAGDEWRVPAYLREALSWVTEESRL